MLQDYWIKGETYSIKEELKSWGCLWDHKKRMWKVLSTNKEDTVYKHIKALEVELVPTKLSKECEEIQKILGRE